jgi:hypothetical protein
VTEVCTRLLHGLTVMSNTQMHLAGYSDDTEPIDVCK